MFGGILLLLLLQQQIEEPRIILLPFFKYMDGCEFRPRDDRVVAVAATTIRLLPRPCPRPNVSVSSRIYCFIVECNL